MGGFAIFLPELKHYLNEEWWHCQQAITFQIYQNQMCSEPIGLKNWTSVSNKKTLQGTVENLDYFWCRSIEPCMKTTSIYKKPAL